MGASDIIDSRTSAMTITGPADLHSELDPIYIHIICAEYFSMR